MEHGPRRRKRSRACEPADMGAAGAAEDPVMVASAAGPEDEEDEGREGVDARLKTYLVQNPVDVDRLRVMALEEAGGLASHDMRQLVWPKMVGVSRFDAVDFRQYLSKPHPSADQIMRDVDRSMWHIQQLGSRSKKKRRGGRRRLLSDIINAMVAKHADLHYYQGYHDLITVLVLVLTEDERLCFSVAERISLHFLRDYMRPSFDALQPLMMLLFPLIRRFDGELADFLDASGVQAFVALPWVITWFSHDVMDLDVVARLFDAFLASPPLLPLYLSAAVIMHRREEVLGLECDFSTVHSTLAKLPPSLPYDDLLHRARAMIHTLPPARLARAAGSKDLLLLWSKGQITALQHAPGPQLLEPDWLLMEQKRWHEGRKVRTKNTRLRRSRAAKAGAVLPPLPSSSSSADGAGGKKNGSKGGLPRALWSVTVLGLTTAAVVGASWYLGSHQEGGGGARVPSWLLSADVTGGALTRTTTDMFARTTTNVMALTRRVTEHRG